MYFWIEILVYFSVEKNMDGVEQEIENSKQDGNTNTISLKSASEIKAGSKLTFFFSLNR